MSLQDNMDETQQWIEERFPQIRALRSDVPYLLNASSIKMFNSHELEALTSWLHATGFLKFIDDPDVPDGYFSFGIKFGTISENLFVMWEKDDRCFWFYDRYLDVYNRSNKIVSTSTSLDLAIELWDKREGHMVLMMKRFFDFNAEWFKDA